MTALPESDAQTSLALKALLRVEHAADGVGHGAGVDDGAVDDGIGRHRLAAERRHAVALARWASARRP